MGGLRKKKTPFKACLPNRSYGNNGREKCNSDAVLKTMKGKILTPGHSDTSDLTEVPQMVIKHDINIFDVLILCFVRASQAPSERFDSNEWPAGHGM
jgi:hypothetical protein